MGKRRRKNDNGGSSSAGVADEFPQSRAEIEVDGSMHEGGGQMVRTSVGLAAALGVSCEVTKIRAGRSKPGLRAQHIAGAGLVAKLGGATLYGAALHSTKLRYEPPEEEIKMGDDGNNGNINIDIGTAGATSLVLQASLPALVARASSSSAISYRINGGGTHVPHAPTADYVEQVLIPTALRFGVILKYDVRRQGFFPRGGGQVSVSARLEPGLDAPHPWVQLVREQVTRVHGVIIVGHNSLRSAAENLRKGVRKVLRAKLGDNFENIVQGEDEAGFEVAVTRAEENGGPSLALTLVAETGPNRGGRFGASRILDARGCRDAGYSGVEEGAHEIGVDVAGELVEDLMSGAVVDRHMADQVMVFMALATDRSRLRVPAVSLHMRSMEEVLTRFGIGIRFEEKDGGAINMVCDGRVTNTNNGTTDQKEEES